MAFEWWHALVLGVVEGITEFLPISSTGHLILASSLMGLDREEDLAGAVNAFNIVIQGGAILAVLGLYWRRVRQMLLGLIGRDPGGLRLLVCLIVAFLPAAVLGLKFNEWIEERLFLAEPVLTALAVGGVYMIVLDRLVVRRMRREDAAAQMADGRGAEGRAETRSAGGAGGTTGEGWNGPDGFDPHDVTTLRLWQALAIGLMQCIAMWPGTSRSMMTITGGVLVGLRPKQAAEFSFLLGLPTLGGACVYKLYKNTSATGAAAETNIFASLGWTAVLIGTAAAMISAALAVRWLVGFLNRNGLEAFGWYRLALAAVLGGLIWGGVVQIGPERPNPAGEELPGAAAVGAPAEHARAE